MKEFTLGGFKNHLLKIANGQMKAMTVGLTMAAKIIQHEAKREIGHLQKGAGRFPAWEPLAESTIDDKIKKGFDFTPDHNPLLRTGELRESIKIEVNVKSTIYGEAIVGSKSPIMAYQEYGTKSIPPRSVIGRAAFVKGKKAIRLLDRSLISQIKGKPIQELIVFESNE